MKAAIAVLVTIIIMLFLSEWSLQETLKRAADVGFIVADKRAYRLVALEPKP